MLQKSKVVSVLIFDAAPNAKQSTIQNNSSRATEVAYEF